MQHVFVYVIPVATAGTAHWVPILLSNNHISPEDSVPVDGSPISDHQV